MQGMDEMKLKFNKESGMTLIELMFAAGVMAVALSMLFGSLINVSAMGKMTESRSTAAADLATVLEQLENLPTTADLVAYQPPDFNTMGPLETVKVEILFSDDTTLELPLDENALPMGMTDVLDLPNPLLLRCTVSWYSAQGHPMSLRGSRTFYR